MSAIDIPPNSFKESVTYSCISSDVCTSLPDFTFVSGLYTFAEREFLLIRARTSLTNPSSVGYLDFLTLSGNMLYMISRYILESNILNNVKSVLFDIYAFSSLTRLSLRKSSMNFIVPSLSVLNVENISYLANLLAPLFLFVIES